MKINHSFTAVLFSAIFSLCHYYAIAQGNGVHVVVIDAGHGGIDPGNLGTRRYKTKEKDISLAVALKLGKYIQDNLPDVKVIYTRTTDIAVSLERRAEIANEAEADVFISVHCDAFTKSSVTGTTSIVLGRNHGDENMRVAIKENSVILLEDNYEETYSGFDPTKPETWIAITLYQNAFLYQSISLAQKIQDEFKTRVQRKDRGVKQQPLYVTSRTAMPAVLVELGFLTNPKEEDFLNSEKGQNYMASAIYRAFRDYKLERDAFEKITAGDTQEIQVPKIIIPTDTAKILDNPDPVEPKESLPTVYYTVQVATSGLKKELIPENFKGQEGIEIYEENGLYKYVYGKAKSLKDANALKQKMKENGFKDAFVIGIKDGQRIPLGEVKDFLQ